MRNFDERIIPKYKDASKNETAKLSDYFEKLPNGLFYKDETGMGATYLEMTSKRNSIIVEPIKVTASNKAFKHNALYVGSETALYPKKNRLKEIAEFVNREDIQYKKIVVVADSLHKVISAIGERNLKNYFLLIDEIDSVQLDSSFRRSMESVIDVYKRFPIENRAMVSATTIAFSDLEIANEFTTSVKYDEPTSRNIKLYYSDNIKGSAITIIKGILHRNPGEKIMIAYNSVSGCMDLIQHVKSNKIIEDGQTIKLLCSSNSRDEAGIYYSELEGEELPATLSFATSAYFTGFDIKERYHLLSISDNKSPISSLSDKRLKQIAGRCRSVLFSETILYNLPANEESKKSLTLIELISIAETEIKALECVKRTFLSNDILSLSHDKIRNLIIDKAIPEEHRFVRIKGDTPVISYLSIDAYLEGERVRNTLFKKKGVLADILRSQGHIIDEVNMVSTTNVEITDVKSISRQSRIEKVFAELRKLPLDSDPKELLSLKNLDSFQLSIIDSYSMLYKCFNREELLDLMEAKATQGRDNRVFKNFLSSAFYFALHPEDHYKREITHQIKIGAKYDNEELLNKWKDVFMSNNMSKPLGESNAVKLTKLHFKLSRWEDTQTRKQLGHKIINDNPYNLTLIKHLPLVNNQTYMNYIFQKPY